MTLPASVAFALVWLIVINLRAMLPSSDAHWRFAYAMIAIGLPLIVWVTMQVGPLIAAVLLLAAGSVLRYPLLYASRWLMGRVRGAQR